MGAIAAIVGGIGGLCAVLGIITTFEVLPPMGEQFTWTFWFFLAAILLLASIALALGRGGGSYD
ncbi:hypothetical protein ACFLX3_05720 [Chloroflexota bacterium]